MNKICAIINLKNQLPFGKALEYFGWCDLYYTSYAKKATGRAVSNQEIDKLNINFKNYDCLLLQHERQPDQYAAFFAKRQNSSIVVIGNQHGFYKSILEIKDRPPHDFDYWNVWGKYWLDRSKEILGKTPKKWVNLGSFLHDYYFQTIKWNPKRTNKKALVIYEPDAHESYQSKVRDIHSRGMRLIFKALKELKMPYDIKAHPLWPRLKGNDGSKMWTPSKKMKNFDIEKIIDYSLILGCRSTVLLDAIAMGMPVVGTNSYSSWKDDHYGPAEKKLFPYAATKKNLKKLIKINFNKKITYSKSKIKYFLGDLGKVSQNYYHFCQLASHKKRRLTKIPIIGRFL